MSIPKTDENSLNLNGYSVGDTITFGKYEQDGNEDNDKEEIEWVILEINKDWAFILSKKALKKNAVF